VRGIEPSSVASDQMLKTLQDRAPAQMEYIIESVARGDAPDYSEEAQMLGATLRGTRGDL